MNLDVTIVGPPRGREFARVTITGANDLRCGLRVEAAILQKLGSLGGEVEVDLFFLGAVVYAVDRLIDRRSAEDAWTRDLQITVPVNAPALWENARPTLEACLRFLTGDHWEFHFTQRDVALWEVDDKQKIGEAQIVSLFSGGLDSFIGIVDWLVTHPGENILLVGHHDPRMSGVLKDQNSVLTELEKEFPNLLIPILPFIGADQGEETTLRSRSFVFLGLGVLCASVQAGNPLLLIPENGMIALNPPLSPSRRGALSTRTAHPHYLRLYQALLDALEIKTKVQNPLVTKTKGESVTQCQDQVALASYMSLTNSCAKRGHTRHWKRRTAGQCGQCMPCIYRRAALHAAGLDTEVYGNDVCTGEVDPNGTGESSNDLRSLLNLLAENPDTEALEDLLFANGHLDTSELSHAAELVHRGFREVRKLFEHKGTPEIRKWISAGGVI
ncbi:Qat anti-phage system QueC-like protein QatC (plasmid) [Deinococcus sp. VB343]|uniref:Qat anti-phage system QueC-like protein QatC n=1 Tax=Deinococcus sp. VB343 TaxID=3385567 RepID=UPI0039C99AE3